MSYVSLNQTKDNEGSTSSSVIKLLVGPMDKVRTHLLDCMNFIQV